MSDHLGMGLHPYRMDIKGWLITESPLHLGDGGVVADKLKKSDQDENPLLSTLLRDGDGLPFIPGSSLKGLLRGLMAERAQADALFGVPKLDKKNHGRMSHVIIWGGSCVPEPVATAPYAAQLGGDSFAAARTAINPETGTADAHKLFFQEMLAPGTKIPLDMLLIADNAQVLDQQWQALLPLLVRLAHGAQLGKGKGDGQGRVRLLPETLTVTRHALQADGTMSTTPVPIPALSQVTPPVLAGRTWTLTLTCPGPFAVLDSSRKRDRKAGQEADKDNPALAGQSLDGNLPHIPGTSLMGALRAQARWLKALKGDPGDGTPAGDAPAVCALFGTTGHRGRLWLEQLKVTAGTKWDVTSVKLDRFSGAPIDGALFTTTTYTGVEATATLRLMPDVDDETTSLTEELLAAIREDGLLLGHGTNKGFGWFDVAVQEGING
ncbi:RAMP superfamily CRISPR-associated protein [Niveispirillum irakense]|uniref:RAMP superfamily CRISPR-associated protein n=1 Tax=Niveispirillum irakense TaxID=34011 RepID=UPI00040A3C39|nr:RAMP superfamily CRISPR-associated protein [Niveispirillum irakense]